VFASSASSTHRDSARRASESDWLNFMKSGEGVVCVCCRIAAELEERGELKSAGPYWTCNVRLNHRRPGLVVQSRVHRESMGDLTAAELAALGPILAAGVAAVGRHGSVERVYTLQYNEGRPGHVHFHVIPRFQQDSGPLGPALRDEMPAGAHIDISSAARDVEDLLQLGRREPSAVVRGTRAMARWWNLKLSPYRWVRVGRRFDRAERYVGVWIGVFACMLVAGLVFGPMLGLAILFSVVAAWRGVDMGLYEIDLLLKMEPSPLKSVPRALVLRVGNLLEIALAIGALLSVLPGDPDGRSAVFSGFRVVLVQPEFGWPSIGTDAVVAAGLALVLLVVTGGIAMLIGKVADSYFEEL
jgi:diadenosine tetraphosphate (Ap4A) HIT family hydrolase